jgi:protein SCO1/2
VTPSRAKTNRAANLAVLAAIVSSSLPAWGQAPDNPHVGHMAMAAGDMLPPVDDGIVVDFALVDRDGKTVSDEDFRGRYVLLGFGFTHCEHICPLMALNMGQVVASAAKPATGIFVSVDTERDTAAISDDYAQHFGESMLGLGGSIEQINAAAKNFKVSYAVTKTQDHYTVQHTANVFLIDPRGELVDVFAFSAGPDQILEAMD